MTPDPGVPEEGEAESEKTLEELVAEGTCPECGTFGGIWHKLGCSFDIRTPTPIFKEDSDD